MENDKDFREWMLDERIKTCVTCGSTRKRLAFEDLPAERKTYFETKLNTDIKEIEYCLYCSHCDEYSVICGSFSSFDDDPASEAPRFAGNPAQNAPCPCGSGKKYKRCCGK